MKRFAAVACMLLVAGLVVAADAKKFDQKCVVSGGPAKEDKTVDYKGGKVYFCCENCPKAFEKDVKKYATKANHQLVATGQAKQAKCPISGGKLNPEKTVKVGGVDVQFCCENCQGKVAKAEGDAQVELVFSDAAFEKAGFAVPKAEKK
ncbi:MAG: YHS domain-containing protein [Planctomycetota bacterium]|jgi:YHS domain-containing protein|nr:MAG: YHS domain-containing protein [Planctomycetota bacterium]